MTHTRRATFRNCSPNTATFSMTFQDGAAAARVLFRMHTVAQRAQPLQIRGDHSSASHNCRADSKLLQELPSMKFDMNTPLGYPLFPFICGNGSGGTNHGS
jgi:hypothetical protein